jgi:hypothetical protein
MRQTKTRQATSQKEKAVRKLLLAAVFACVAVGGTTTFYGPRGNVTGTAAAPSFGRGK